MNQYDLDNIKPFNFYEAVAYNADFIRGYSVEHYDSTLKNCYSQSKIYMKQQITDIILSKYHYDRVVYFDLNTKYSNQKYCYYLLPTYKLDFEYKNKKYSTFMNGQTGTIGAGMPKSKVKITLTVLLSILVVAGIILLSILSN